MNTISHFEDPLACAERGGAALRRQRRVSFQHQAWAVDLAHAENRHSVLTQDISVQGVGFVTIHPFPQNTWIVLTLTFDSGAHRKILCRSRRCLDVGNGFFLVGAEFAAAVPDDPTQPAVPPEWLEWVHRADEPEVINPGRAVLEPELIPGVFAEPSIKVMYEDV
ncbi:MAG: PilZ domain-containing protein [Phycisphaerae bacterium]